MSSISPGKLSAGAAATTVTVAGTNFTSASSVQVGTVVEQTTYVSATQLTASVPAAQLVSGASLPVIVLNGNATSASGAPVNLEVDNPSPVIASLTPASIAVGSASTTVSVTGSGFVPTSTVQVNGASRTTIYVSGTQVNVVLSAADLATAGSVSLAVVNAAPGGGTSSASAMAVNSPAPSIVGLSPATVLAGTSTPTTITINGANFIGASTVQVGTAAHTPTLVSPTQLTFSLSVAEEATAGKLAVTVANPSPGGGNATANLSVNTPTSTPTLTSANPTAFIVGGANAAILAVGTNFGAGSQVLWNGTPLTTSGNSTTLSAAVPSSLLSSVGTATITVTSPTALNPVSNPVSVSINNPPAPTLATVSPGYGPINTGVKVTLTGANFTTNTTVKLNGSQVTSTFVSSSSLTVLLPASSVAQPGNYAFTVSTPSPGGGTSGTQVYTAYIPLVSNSMVYNPVDGLLYASIPGSVGPPMGNSIVSVDPATGAIGTPIFVGSEPDKLALTADGRYLWVGLDGASSVRKVDLVAKTAGLQFSLPLTNKGIYAPPAGPQALAALPGATDSVIVALSNGSLSNNVGLAIFDSGVARPNSSNTTTIYNNEVLAIRTDATRQEIYAGGSGTYDTFNYNSTGLVKLNALTNISTASTGEDEMQLLGGKIYTDFGPIYDAEAGALLGTLYLTGTTAAQGATLADATLGKIFVLDTAPATGGVYASSTQIQIFNLSNYTSTGVTIPINVSSTSGYPANYPTRLTRWGANGLVLHTGTGIFSIQSNSVADLSSTTADLSVTITTGGSTTTGGNTTFVAKVTNNGPATATDIVLTAQAPLTGTLLSATPAAGSCSTATGIACSLGNLASGASDTVTFTVFQTNSGTSTLAAQVTGSTADSSATNNSATGSVTVTGNAYNPVPVLTSIVPAAIETGAADTTLTVNGSGFTTGSTVMLGSTSLSTSLVSSTQLMALVPAASVANMGWAPVTVSTATPGGGTSAPLPLTFYSVITIGVNHILYDPYSRNIMASVGSGASSVTGNSIAAIDPTTAAVGTPVSIGSQPTNLALSSDGQILYTILTGSQSVARYNMLTGQPDFTYAVPTNSSFVGGIALRGIAVQPGTEDTIALDIASFTGNAIYDFNPTTKTAAIRGQASGPYSGSCISFLDAADLLAFDTDTSGASLDHYVVTSSGFTYYNYSQIGESTLNHFGCFKLSGGLAFANGGGIANPSTQPATQVATLAGVSGGGFSTSQALAPDASLQRAFYPATSVNYPYQGDGITVFDLNHYEPVTTLPLNMATIEGSSSGYSEVDIVRWGQDGLAILTSTGHIYLLRGAVVVPGLMTSGAPAASLSSVSSTTLTKGSGNVLLTVTGSGFAPGVAVTWNGSYRTTTIVDATHVTVAIPASDLTSAGTGSLVATNPGATASNSLSVTVQ
ncbi:MAG TPA: IPT/TIG domain-containing protein [Acidobacteriaceae bacterium]|nr:IPT/TIG domain-containing protein [Acidobacteriaceae bacterium]